METYLRWNTPPHPGTYRLTAAALALTRRINKPTARVSAALADPAVTASLRRIALGDRGVLVIDRPLAVPDGVGSSWRGRGRLCWRGGRIARCARVHIEITPCSAQASELLVRPTSRRAARWGARRLRRYLELAPLAADQLWRITSAAAPSATATAETLGNDTTRKAA